MKIVIVGGVAGGASAAARLRRLDETAEIVLFEKGSYISFANCGLPYFIGGVITDKEELTLQTPDSFYARFHVDVRVEQEVVSIDTQNKCVRVKHLATGETYEESYDKLVLSPGAKPIIPPIQGVSSSKVFTLRNIPDTYAIKAYVDTQGPKSAIVVGGGYIGIEVAENLHEAGLDVTVVELADHIIGPLDLDMAAPIQGHMEEKGVKILTNQGVNSIRDVGEHLMVQVGEQELPADMLILSVGVIPESGLTKGTDIATDARGAIVVNEHMETSVPDIYAVGDVVASTHFITNEKGMIPLAGPANKQGRIAADNICGIPSTYKGTQGSSILKCFDMTAANTGINESLAKKLGIDYEKTLTISGSHAGYYPGAMLMFIKVLYAPDTHVLLGAQVVGFDGVDKRCDVLATAIRGKMTMEDLTELELCYAPPYGSAKDPVNMAGYVGENTASQLHKPFFWEEMEDIDFSRCALVDVRTQEEYDMAHIEGSLHIPVDELRGRLGELQGFEKVYITCRVGQRGHVATRILMQHGIDAYNLAGGFALYACVARVKKLGKKIVIGQ